MSLTYSILGLVCVWYSSCVNATLNQSSACQASAQITDAILEESRCSPTRVSIRLPSNHLAHSHQRAYTSIALCDEVEIDSASHEESVDEVKADTRGLLQIDEGESAAGTLYECTLSTEQINEYSNARRRTWTVNDAVLEDVLNDLQSIVNCTKEGDTVLFDVDGRIRPATRVTIPWSLTISAETETLDLEDGVFHQTRKKATFVCPRDNEGVFLVRARRVLFANLDFEKCLFGFSATPLGIVEVDKCSGSRTRRRVQLHHVRFLRNQVGTSTVFRVHSPSCSAVEMIDVSFRENNYSAIGCVQLSSENTIREVSLRKNRVEVTQEDVQGFLHAPLQSRTVADEVFATGNQGVLLEVQNGTLTVSNSRFFRNSVDIPRGRYPFGKCIRMTGTVASIVNSSFRQNGGTHSAGIHGLQSNITVNESFFEGNRAQSGGAILVEQNSLITLGGCTFESNHVEVKGAAILSIGSRFRGVDLIFHNNTSDRSGASIQCERSSRMELSRSRFTQNTAPFGGSIVLVIKTSGNVSDCFFSDNNGRSGGNIYVGASEINCKESRMVRCSSEAGALLFLYNSTARLSDLVMENGTASIAAGGIYFERESEASAQNLSVRNCTSGEHGGAIFLTGSTFHAVNATFLDNKAADSGGTIFADARSLLNLSGSTFSRSSALLGGTVTTEINTTANMVNCAFSSSAAELNGGFWFADKNSTVTFDGCLFSQSRAEFGGAIHVSDNSRVSIQRTIMANSTAVRGGCIEVAENSEVEMISVTAQNATVVEDGGALRLDKTSVAVIKNSTLSSCNAGINGGAVFASQSNLTADDLKVDSNVAGTHGGGIFAEESSVISIENSTFSKNTARGSGGAAALETEAVAILTSITFADNSASGRGGAARVRDARLRVQNTALSGCHADAGSCLSISNSSAEIQDSLLKGSDTASVGGLALVEESGTLQCVNVTMTEGKAVFGGALALISGTLEGQGLHITNCSSQRHGGAIMGNGSSTVFCSMCIFQGNRAKGRGGALSIESDSTQALAILLDGSTINNNSAEYGGGLHFVGSTVANCSGQTVDCAPAFLVDTDFVGNKAEQAGGTIFSSDLDAIGVSCHSGSEERDTEPRARLQQIRSRSFAQSVDACDSWTGNQAGAYGQNVASYARLSKKKIRFEERNETIEVEGNTYVVKNHASGTPIPTIQVEVVDALGQGPAIGIEEDTVEAIMQSPDDFFAGSVSVFLEGGKGNFSGITGYKMPNTYEIHITFSEAALESFVLIVEVRECSIGEEAAANGLFCEKCSGATYNFFPEKRCVPCPSNGNCTSQVIRPNQGYWHKTPCSVQLQRCLEFKACDFKERDQRLTEIGQIFQKCDVNEESAQNYTQTQCREGYTGPLCGSCEADYGRFQSFSCRKCLVGFANVGLIVLSSLVLLALSSFTVRSNLMSIVRRISRRCRRSQDTTQSEHSVQINFEMVEMMCSGHVPQEVLERAQREAASPEDMIKTAELAKWKAAEMFKITVNYLQVTAVAVAINVQWTLVVMALFEVAELISGVTTEAVNRSVDCLVSDGSSLERTIISSLIDALLPVSVICVFSLFWAIGTVRHKKSKLYFLKRLLLSAVAVFYIVYISLTKTLIGILTCVSVYDSVSFLDDATTDYWAADTSIKCYEGSHAVLAGALSWPLLVVFTVGYPVVMAYNIIREVKDDYKEGWIYDVAGFLYRAYRKRFVFWESVIMLRKAILAIVVVFSHPLGANLQGVLAVFVLALALYLQAVCHPYRQEFKSLNELESISILVSLLTFVSSLFFNDSRVSYAVKILISVGICLCNIALFFSFVMFFLYFSAIYLRCLLDSEVCPMSQIAARITLSRPIW